VGTVGKLCDIIFKLFINWSSVRNNLVALSVESARKRNRLLKVYVWKSSKIEHSRGGGVCNAPQDSLALYIRNRIQRVIFGTKNKFGLRFRRIGLVARVAERSLLHWSWWRHI